jgi:hypothetical protein
MVELRMVPRVLHKHLQSEQFTNLLIVQQQQLHNVRHIYAWIQTAGNFVKGQFLHRFNSD